MIIGFIQDNKECENDEGGFKCVCKNGYIRNRETNKCIVNRKCPSTHKCSHSCTLDNGIQICSCPVNMLFSSSSVTWLFQEGYELDGEGLICLDINECESKLKHCPITQVRP